MVALYQPPRWRVQSASFFLTVYAGILWMTAAGDPKKVQKAKDILVQSTTGVVICLLAYGFTFWVFTLGKTLAS